MHPRKSIRNIAPLFRPYYSETVKVKAGTLMFIAGQVSFDKSGKPVHPGNVKAQARQALENLKHVLAEHGATMDDLCQMTVYITDMRFLDDIAEVRNEYFPKNGPTSAIVEVNHLALPELMVEFATIAVVD